MADIKHSDIDAFLADPVAVATDYDPQSSVGVQSLKALGKAVESGPAISKAPMEGVEPESDPFTDLAGGMIASRLGPSVADAIAGGIKAADFGKIAGNEIGAVGKNVKKAIPKERVAPRGKELPMDEASRMARAKKMGFDTDQTYYHGTPRGRFDEFDPYATPRDYNGEIAGYFTKDKKLAEKFANTGIMGDNEDAFDPHVFETHIKANNPFDYQNREHIDKLVNSLSKETLKDIAKSNTISGKPMSLSQLKQQFELGNWNFLEDPRVIKAIKSNGHDSMHAYENGNKTLAVFEPNQIRETTAKFDPSKASSGNIAASIGGVGLGGAAAASQDAEASEPQSFARGGSVKEAKISSQYPPAPVIPVKGLTVSAPEGLDQFLNTSKPVAGATDGSEPAGLSDFIEPELKEEKYGTLGQIGKTALEGAGRGLIGPLAPMLETSLGVNPEDIRGREETNPVTHYGSEVAGLVGPALVTGGASAGGRGVLAGLAKYGTQSGVLEAVGKVLPKAAGETLASKVGLGAARAAIDNMLIAGSDETSKMILNDPNQSAETAIANIGLAGAIGGGLGGAFGAAGPLWKATVGDKTSKLIEDFKGRIQEHLDNPDPVKAVGSELSDYYNKITSLGDDVYGPQGLKAKDIAKALPEMNEKIASQVQGMHDKIDTQIKKMIQKQNVYPARLTSKLQGDLETFSNALSHDNLSSADVFNAAQDLKQSLQGYSKYDKFVKPVDEAYDFVRDAKSLAHNLRSSLEDKAIWGKAAERQHDINEAFREYLPALKDFEKKFTTEVGGEKQIDPTKINTYINQLGKPNAEIKQDILRNFLDASEKYKKVISESHMNLGMESPVQDAAMNSVLSTLNEKTTGGRLADAFIDKGLKAGGSHALAASTGAGIGGLLGGHVGAGLGAILGQHAFAPFFNSVLPAIAKAVVGNRTSSEGFKAAVDYSSQVVKGESLISRSIKNVLKAGSEVLPESMHPSEKDTARLDKMLKSIQTNPQGYLDKAKPANHYMPEHSSAMDQSTMNAANYLNMLRPDMDPKAPLDSKPVASTAQVAAFNNALQIAQQPMVVLDRIKKGTVTAEDIKTLGNIYPSLYNRIKAKITSEIVNMTDKNNIIPYTTRIGLSMFLAQPLDSSMSPKSIQSTQIQNRSPQSNSPQMNQGSQHSKGVKSSPALQKMPTMFQTQGQARQQRQLKD